MDLNISVLGWLLDNGVLSRCIQYNYLHMFDILPQIAPMKVAFSKVADSEFVQSFVVRDQNLLSLENTSEMIRQKFPRYNENKHAANSIKLKTQNFNTDSCSKAVPKSSLNEWVREKRMKPMEKKICGGKIRKGEVRNAFDQSEMHLTKNPGRVRNFLLILVFVYIKGVKS